VPDAPWASSANGPWVWGPTLVFEFAGMAPALQTRPAANFSPLLRDYSE